jgi:hypothetical protein
MKKFTFFFLFFCLHFISKSQDSTLVGRFGFSGYGAYSKSNIAEEIAKGGFGGEFRYFPSPKVAFVLSYQNMKSGITRFGKQSSASNYSMSLGIEKHFDLGNFSPYIGQEIGLNFTKVKSHLIAEPANLKNFQNDLPNYLIKPKIGLHYKITDNLHAQLQGSFNWVFSTDRQNTNPLLDENYEAIYFGRKAATFSIGIMYLFDE